MSNKGIELTCGKCNHTWKYKGILKVKCTCPDCRQAVKVKPMMEEKA